MARGLFSQGAFVLFERAPTMDDVERVLAPILRGRRDPRQGGGWIGGFDRLVHAFDPALNGSLVVDAIDRSYPDDMGDPNGDADAVETFGCWSLGGFGPLAFPGGLARAAAQSIAVADAPARVARHAGLVRMRTTYALGAERGDPVLPKGHDPLRELALLARCGRALLDLEGALLYFNSSGETLADAAEMDAALAHARRAELPAIELHTHVRLWRVGDGAPGRTLMDVVGLGQLDLPDLEALFPDALDPNVVATFLRNVTVYLLSKGDVLEHHHTIDGPGGRWRVARLAESGVAPPRPVIRLTPEAV